jgi:hypothetical protein
MLQNSAKKKRRREISTAAVVSSSESFLHLLKRLMPSLRERIEPNEPGQPPQRAANESGVEGPKRPHARKSVRWARGRGFLAIGFNECMKLLGKTTRKILCAHRKYEIQLNCTEKHSPEATVVVSLAPANRGDAETTASAIDAPASAQPAAAPATGPAARPPRQARLLLVCRGARPVHLVEPLVDLARRRGCPCRVRRCTPAHKAHTHTHNTFLMPQYFRTLPIRAHIQLPSALRNSRRDLLCDSETFRPANCSAPPPQNYAAHRCFLCHRRRSARHSA